MQRYKGRLKLLLHGKSHKPYFMSGRNSVLSDICHQVVCLAEGVDDVEIVLDAVEGEEAPLAVLIPHSSFLIPHSSFLTPHSSRYSLRSAKKVGASTHSAEGTADWMRSRTSRYHSGLLRMARAQ